MELPKETDKNEEKPRDMRHETWFTRRIAKILVHGLTDRITLLRTRTTVLDQYALDHAPSNVGQQVVVGLLLNASTARRLVDLGPAADDTAKVILI